MVGGVVTGAQDRLARARDFAERRGPTVPGPDAVNTAMIRHWCDALGDRNPAYLDAGSKRGIIAPPAMLQAWTMPGFVPASPHNDPTGELYGLLDELGYTSIVATNCEQDYFRPLRPGDTVLATRTINSVSEEKKTALGQGVFVTSTIEVTTQDGTPVGRHLHRVLKFQPRPAEPPSPPSPPPALRPRPNVTLDTKFFFEAAKRHVLVIQHCPACNRLQHPPTAACIHCGSLELDIRKASGRGTLYSFTVVHAPAPAPFKTPYTVGLVELEEGTRLVAQLVDVEPGDVKIGMPLEVVFLDCDADLTLPVFGPRKAPPGERRWPAATDVEVGTRLPPLRVALSRSLIIAAAIASRDYQDIHHDPEAARRRGAEDIFMNILATNGLVSRFVTDWAGPAALLRRIAIKLGAQNYPDDTMVLSGNVVAKRDGKQGAEVEIAVRGANSRGDHVTGSVVLELPAKQGDRS